MTNLMPQLLARSEATGRIELPAVPALCDEYVTVCVETFAKLGSRFTDAETDQLRAILADKLTVAFTASNRSSITVEYRTGQGNYLAYEVTPRWWTLAEAYDNWLFTRPHPMFGHNPDARVWMAAHEYPAAGCPVLDIGSGTGRNALALARRGHPVDAVEVSSKFAASLRGAAELEGLGLRVIKSEVFADEGLRSDYGLIVLSGVVSDFRDFSQLAELFDLAALHLAPEGQLVFNVFLPRNGYEPDDAARQYSQQAYSMIFTHDEMAAAAQHFELVSDDSVYEYEKSHLEPEGAWPPVDWYPDWISGLDVFGGQRGESPIEMRWLVYRLNH